MEATVTVVTEQQLVVVLRRAAQGARLAFYRRKIRLIESNAKCRYLKILTCKGTLRQVFYLSEVPSSLIDDPILPPLHTVSSILIHTGK